MYFPEADIAHVAIPKTGTTSFRDAGDGLFPGHLHMSQLLREVERNFGRQPREFVAVVREPEERLLSAVNFLMGQKGWTVEQTFRRTTHVAFRPQVGFLDRTDLPLKLFPFEELASALQYVFGPEITVPHSNPSEPLTSLSEIYEYIDPAWFRQEYRKDFALYEKARGNAMNNTNMPAPKVTMYGLVRDRNGKPRIDGDPRELHESIKAAMTPLEYETACKEYDNAAQ